MGNSILSAQWLNNFLLANKQGPGIRKHALEQITTGRKANFYVLQGAVEECSCASSSVRVFIPIWSKFLAASIPSTATSSFVGFTLDVPAKYTTEFSLYTDITCSGLYGFECGDYVDLHSLAMSTEAESVTVPIDDDGGARFLLGSARLTDAGIWETIDFIGSANLPNIVLAILVTE